MDKIGVMVLINHLGTGGAETHVIQLAKNLNPDRYKICLVCLKEEGYRFSTVNQRNVEKYVCHLPSINNVFRTLKTVISLYRLAQNKNIKIIHTYIFNPTVVGTLIKLLFRLRRTNVKLITTRRDTGFWHTERHWKVYKAINRFADRIACVCEAAREVTEKKEGVAPDKLITIYNGIDLSEFRVEESRINGLRQTYDIPSASIVIGIVAIFRPEKRHDVFIDAALALLERYNHKLLRFVIIGDGETEIKEQMVQKIEAAGAEEHFIFTGLLTDIKPAMAALDIMALCSDYEAMSNAIVEAMAMGKTVVATRVGGNVELIEHGRTGLLFEKGSAKGLQESLSILIDDTKKLAQMSTASRLHAEQAFDLSVMVDRTQKLYEEVLNEQR